jgi:hypothetical protein
MKIAFALILSFLATVSSAKTDFDPIKYPKICIGALTSYQEEQGLDVDRRTKIAEQVTYFVHLDFKAEGRGTPTFIDRTFYPILKLRDRVEREFNMFELTDIRKTCQQAYKGGCDLLECR